MHTLTTRPHTDSSDSSLHTPMSLNWGANDWFKGRKDKTHDKFELNQNLQGSSEHEIRSLAST